VNDDGLVTGLEFLEVDTFAFDEEGRPQIDTVEGSEQVVASDTVIFAVGQVPEIPEGFDVDLTDRRLIELDPYTASTSREGVFAAGDAVSGTASVIKDIASGRKAAQAVDKFLGGSGRIDRRLAPVAEPQSCLGRGEGFAALTRAADACVIPEQLVDDFCEVVRGMEEGEALGEAERCLQCDLRLKIQTVKFWGSY
jgi:NADPH-dependent glutamate synthase beta subunit-like oxidoreductase